MSDNTLKNFSLLIYNKLPKKKYEYEIENEIVGDNQRGGRAGTRGRIDS